VWAILKTRNQLIDRTRRYLAQEEPLRGHTVGLSLGVAAFCTLVRLMEGECMPDVPSYAAYQEALEGRHGPPTANKG
jgi:hypothetical protein